MSFNPSSRDVLGLILLKKILPPRSMKLVQKKILSFGL